MSKYKPQHSRLLFIDRKIGEGRYPNCGTLAEEWEVSNKTIMRDLDYMRYQLEAPLEYSAKHRGYYYTEENFKLPAISIKESDLFAIYLAVLARDTPSPFLPESDDEEAAADDAKEEKKEEKKDDEGDEGGKDDDVPAVVIDFDGLAGRIIAVAGVVDDSPDLYLPSDRVFGKEIDRLRIAGRRVREVTNLAANRIRDLDRRGVPWKNFHEINFVNIDYKPFDASEWLLAPSGLLGPVRLVPLTTSVPGVDVPTGSHPVQERR